LNTFNKIKDSYLSLIAETLVIDVLIVMPYILKANKIIKNSIFTAAIMETFFKQTQ